MQRSYLEAHPDDKGYFGRFGGAYLPPVLEEPFAEIARAYETLKRDPAFIEELKYVRKHYQGRPTPVSFARNLTARCGGAKIYLKREDLNHTGAHKLNHCMAEVILAKHLGKTKVIAETGAGQHGVALATAAAYFGLECEIHMGEVDIAKEHPNVIRMKILGAKVVPATHGLKTLKEAVDSAFESYLSDPINAIYCIGSVVGPHPFPMMVRDFQSVIGFEAKEQFLEHEGKLPDNVVACVGGGLQRHGQVARRGAGIRRAGRRAVAGRNATVLRRPEQKEAGACRLHGDCRRGQLRLQHDILAADIFERRRGDEFHAGPRGAGA